MTIEALVSGKLHEPARERTAAASGRRFVTAKLRVPVGDGPDVFTSVVAFDAAACAALLALDAGDGVSLAGTLKPGAWLDREGNPRPSVDLVANVVMTTYGVRRKRVAAQGGPEPAALPASRDAPAPDLGPEDEAWLAGGAA